MKVRSGPVFCFQSSGPRPGPVFTSSRTAKDCTEPRATGLVQSSAVFSGWQTSCDRFESQPVANWSEPVFSQVLQYINNLCYMYIDAKWIYYSMSMYDLRENQPTSHDDSLVGVEGRWRQGEPPTSHGNSLVVVEGRWRPVAGVASGGVGVAGVAGGRGARAPNESQ